VVCTTCMAVIGWHVSFLPAYLRWQEVFTVDLFLSPLPLGLTRTTVSGSLLGSGQTSERTRVTVNQARHKVTYTENVTTLEHIAFLWIMTAEGGDVDFNLRCSTNRSSSKRQAPGCRRIAISALTYISSNASHACCEPPPISLS
jgi:hypothetical protein